MKMSLKSSKPLTRKQSYKNLPVVEALAQLNDDPRSHYLLGTLEGRLKKSEWQTAAKEKRDAKKRERASKRLPESNNE